ncbi:MAG: AbgT family transporter [Eubacteriales bacterium]|nr:AbgT family transporter [Eubacteriales bacterium]
MIKKSKKDGEITAAKPINPMIILAVIIIIAAIATYVIPAGSFDRIPSADTGYDTVAIDSFHYVDQNPIGIFNIFESFTIGLQDAAYIIFFLMIIGGTFQVVEATGALHAGLSNLVIKLKGKEMLLIPVCVFVFGLVSATAACCEEYLAFLPLMYVVCVAAGFDSLTAVALLFCSSAIGYAGGMTNAFTVGVAQTIAELPLFSGMGLRVAIYLVLATISSVYFLLHVRKIQKHPELNTMHETDKHYAEQLDLDEVRPMTGRDKLILFIFAFGFIAVAFCVIKLGFYIDEMSAIFLIVGLLIGIIAKMSPSDFADHFVEGCKNLLWAGLIIGMCNAVTNIMTDANVMDTLIYAMGNVLGNLPAKVSACGMFVMQDLLNFLIPSGSGQAAVTMPFMAPLSDILGVSRQTAVLAFQMGDAFTNVITPTSGELMAALAICHVPYKKWFRFLAPLWLIWAVVACVFLVLAVSIGYV